MGCSNSKKLKFVPNDSIEGQDQSVYEIAQLLDIQDEEIDILYTIYKELDVRNTGNIHPADIFTFMNSDFSQFEKSVFQIFDADKSGKYNFLEFICCMWNFLTLPETQLGAIVYLMKDPSGVLRVNYNELKDMFDIIHKRKLEASHTMQTIFHHLRDEFTPELSIQDVVKWSSHSSNTTILTPLLLLQLKLRRFIIGENYWMKKTIKRNEDPEKSRPDYIREFQKVVKNKLIEFKIRKNQAAHDKKIGSRDRLDRAQQNVARKQSMLLDAFKMKPKVSLNAKNGNSPSSNSRVVPVDNTNEDYKKMSKEERMESGIAKDGKLFQSSSSQKKSSSKSKLPHEQELMESPADNISPSRKQPSNISTRTNTASASNLNAGGGGGGGETPSKSSKSKKK